MRFCAFWASSRFSISWARASMPGLLGVGRVEGDRELPTAWPSGVITSSPCVSLPRAARASSSWARCRRLQPVVQQGSKPSSFRLAADLESGQGLVRVGDGRGGRRTPEGQAAGGRAAKARTVSRRLTLQRVQALAQRGLQRVLPALLDVQPGPQPCRPSSPCLASQGLSLPSVWTFSCSARRASSRAQVDAGLPGGLALACWRWRRWSSSTGRFSAAARASGLRPVPALRGCGGSWAFRSPGGPLPGAARLQAVRRSCAGAGTAHLLVHAAAGRRPAPGSAAAPGDEGRAARWRGPGRRAVGLRWGAWAPCSSACAARIRLPRPRDLLGHALQLALAALALQPTAAPLFCSWQCAPRRGCGLDDEADALFEPAHFGAGLGKAPCAGVQLIARRRSAAWRTSSSWASTARSSAVRASRALTASRCAVLTRWPSLSASRALQEPELVQLERAGVLQAAVGGRDLGLLLQLLQVGASSRRMSSTRVRFSRVSLRRFSVSRRRSLYLETRPLLRGTAAAPRAWTR